ncbi:MAG: hypothetical protein WC947_02755 [Elusimicrobiota bacterium]
MNKISITKSIFLDASALVKYFLKDNDEKGVEIIKYLIDELEKEFNRGVNVELFLETASEFIDETKKVLKRKYESKNNIVKSITENEYQTALAILDTEDFIHKVSILVKEKDIIKIKKEHPELSGNDCKLACIICAYFKSKKLRNELVFPILADKNLKKYCEKEGFDVINPESIKDKNSFKDFLLKKGIQVQITGDIAEKGS